MKDETTQESREPRLGLMLSVECTEKIMRISRADGIHPNDVVAGLINGLYSHRYENKDA